MRAGGFIDRYVFPDGELEGVGTIASAMQDNGFEIRHEENLREHYALTLRDWGAQPRGALGRGGRARSARARPGSGACTWPPRGSASITRRIELHQILGVKVPSDGSNGEAGVPLRPWF